jgi:hypothetical protein
MYLQFHLFLLLGSFGGAKEPNEVSSPQANEHNSKKLKGYPLFLPILFHLLSFSPECSSLVSRFEK